MADERMTRGDARSVFRPFVIASIITSVAGCSPTRGSPASHPSTPIAWTVWAPPARDLPSELALQVGESITVPAAGVVRYAVGVADIADADVAPDGQTLRITGKAPGATSLLLLGADNQSRTVELHVSVSTGRRSPRDEVPLLIQDIPRVSFREVDRHLYIEVIAPTAKDLRRLQHIATVYRDQVILLIAR